jgi:hypothetical protein
MGRAEAPLPGGGADKEQYPISSLLEMGRKSTSPSFFLNRSKSSLRREKGRALGAAA